VILPLALGFCLPLAAQTLPPLLSLRAEENWSALRDPALRTGAWERIKFIPLGKTWFLTLGVDFRERYEGYKNEGFGTGTRDGNGYLQHRAFFHADVRSGSRLRFFGQVKTAHQSWRLGPPRANDIDRLDLHQGFVEAVLIPGRVSLSLRAGRQEILFGSTRLTGVREGPNVRITFDAARMILRSERGWRIDALISRPVETRRGLFNDYPEHGRTFWGIYASRPVRQGSRAIMDAYYFGLARKQARFFQGQADERRETLGFRFARSPAEAVAFDHDWEIVAQWGRFGGGSIRAWYIATDTGFTLHGARFRPRLALKANAASGDRNPLDNRLGTFNAMFPDTRDFREQAFPGPYNVSQLRPYVETRYSLLGRPAVLNTSWEHFWRTRIGDGLYSFGAVPYRMTGSSAAHYVGSKPAVVAQWLWNRHWTLTAIYAHFFGARFVREAMAGRSPRYAAVVVLFRF